MIIEINEKEVQNKIIDWTITFKKLAETMLESEIVLMAADKYLNANMAPSEKLKYMFYSDIIICMKNLGHDFSRYDYESLPYKIVYHSLAFEKISFETFLKDERCLNLARDAFDFLAKSNYVGSGELKELNLPIILEHTPFYDSISTYYKLLFKLSKYTTIVDQKIDKDEFLGLYAFTKYIDIEEL